MEEYDRLGGSQENILQLSMEKSGGYKTEVEERIETRERLALGHKVKEEEHLEIYGGLREDIGVKTYLHGPMDYAKTLKLRFRVRGLPGRTKTSKPVVERRRKKMRRCALVAKQ